MTAPEVGVLLPVRLELRFVAPGALDDGVAEWRLRIRIVPDAISVIDHDPMPSQLELDAVETMWRRAGSDDLDSPSGRRAWEGLITAVGLERAAWLARTFRPHLGPGDELTITRPATVREEPRRSRLAGLPPTIELWLARGGSAPTQAAELTVLVDELPLDFADPEQDRGEWWTSFDEAVRVGLAAEIGLGSARPVDIDVMYAVGIGGGDPGPLLAAHGDSGRLGLLAPGTATTSIDGEALAGVGGDADDWRTLVATPVDSQAGTMAVLASTLGATSVEGATTLPALTAVPGGEVDHRPLNQALMATLWPALWGHSVADVNGFDDADRLGVWAADNVVPEGPLPTLRIGDRPYGLLPVTSLRRWRRAGGDPTIERQLVPLIDQLVDRWARAAEPSTTPRPPPFLDHLVATPNATAYSWRWMVPLELAAGVSFRFGATMDAAEASRWWQGAAGGGPRLSSQPADPNRRLVGVGDRRPIEGGLVAGDGRGVPSLEAIRRGVGRRSDQPSGPRRTGPAATTRRHPADRADSPRRAHGLGRGGPDGRAPAPTDHRTAGRRPPPGHRVGALGPAAPTRRPGPSTGIGGHRLPQPGEGPRAAGPAAAGRRRAGPAGRARHSDASDRPVGHRAGLAAVAVDGPGRSLARALRLGRPAPSPLVGGDR